SRCSQHRTGGRMASAPPGLPFRAARRRGAYWTFAVSEASAFKVKVQVGVLFAPLLHTPDQSTDRPLVTLSVMLVPGAKGAERVVPTGTLRPAGVERTVSPARPVARVSVGPQTFATPPPPQICGAVQVPQVSVPPQPSRIVPQFFPWAAQVVGVQTQPGRGCRRTPRRRTCRRRCRDCRRCRARCSACDRSRGDERAAYGCAAK